MKEFLKTNGLRYLLSSLLFGVFYSVLSLIDKGHVEYGIVLGTMACYFLSMCLLSFLAPKLRKLTGHDQKKK